MPSRAESGRRIALYAVLAALALALSYIERFFPLGLVIPLPGVRIGFANIVTLYAVLCLGARPALIILLSRCVLGSFFGGGVTGLIFSLSGGLLALCGMLLLKPLYGSFVSIYGIGIAGSALHNLGQIAAACLTLGSLSAAAYLPVLLCAGLATGLITSAVARPLFSALSARGYPRRFFGGGEL